ncbi:hypothetical protein [Microbacterium sp. 179-I 3D3 NHS]|uniref:hypothetical protein n=1 Tax=unclassified Microbacterium TaxID=2609290 RepID=UPI0039A230E7
MSDVPDPRYVMKRLTASEWVINDLRYPPNDPRHVVACVYEVADTEVEVTWLRELPLASRYCSVFEVLEDVERMHGAARSARATRPIAIPSRPPLLAT